MRDFWECDWQGELFKVKAEHFCRMDLTWILLIIINSQLDITHNFSYYLITHEHIETTEHEQVPFTDPETFRFFLNEPD